MAATTTTTPDFDAQFDEAFRKMEGLYQQHNQKTFHPSYPPLFKKLWCACDVSRSGFLNDRSMCDKFAQTMISNGWKDWEPSQHEISLWDAIFAIHGKISIEEFCQIAEDPNYPMPDAAQITKAHEDWLKQGGDNPGAPSTGPSSFRVFFFFFDSFLIFFFFSFLQNFVYFIFFLIFFILFLFIYYLFSLETPPTLIPQILGD